MPRYLEPTAPIAEAAVLTGDPKRAMELATAVTDRPLMSNLARGLWGYHGTTESGVELSVHSTGIGGPSTALVLRELHGHGIRRAIRVGTATALGGSLELGTAAPVGEVWGNDGTSAALRAGEIWRDTGGQSDVVSRVGSERLESDPGLLASLEKATGHAAIGLVSLDLPFDLAVGAPEDLLRLDLSATDLSTAAFLAQAEALGVEAAAIVVMTAGPAGDLPLADADAACLAAGRVAAELLATN